jgi:putative metallohydrolase (TIGR04338 family)
MTETVRPRDSQRARLYRAEFAVHHGRRLATVERMQAWVDGLCAMEWFVARWGSRSFDVRPGFGHRRATADENGVLQMPKWARTELVLLHEVAHCLTPSTCASHGPEYAGVLLALARRGMGPGTAQRLEDAFASERVRWTLAGVPEAQSSVRAERMAASLASVSSHSLSGSDPATMPAPATSRARLPSRVALRSATAQSPSPRASTQPTGPA